jgi:uncharacterized protein with GYD domain
MAETPGDRTAAVRAILDRLGGRLESIYWMFGPHDGFVVCEVPDSVGAGALSVAVNASGAFKHLETHELLSQEQLADMLGQAKTARDVYQPPGQ